MVNRGVIMHVRLISVAIMFATAFLSWPLSVLATPVSGELYYTRYKGNPRVEKVAFDFDGTTLTLGTPTPLASNIGADGIAGNPNDNNSLLVGGQGKVVYRVAKSGGVIGAAPTETFAFHIEVADSSALYVYGIPGQPSRVTLNPDGTIGPSVALVATPGSADGIVTQIISTPSGFYYTSSGKTGYGTFGTISFSGNSFTTTRLHGPGGSVSTSSLPAAHGGVYDPFTDSIILFGDNHITQLDLLGNVLSDLDTTYMGMPFSLDQGTVDGQGHIYVANNSGYLVFIDYTGGANRVNDPTNVVTWQYLADYLDDLAPLVGAGSTKDHKDVPEPGTLALLGAGLAGLGFVRRRRKAA